MIYVNKNETNEKIYSVYYDREKLKDILEQLKDFSYTVTCHGQVSGNITRWPATNKMIKKRVIAAFYNNNKNPESTIYPETIVHHNENNYDYVTYDYSYKKNLDLYEYINLIVNDGNLLNYKWLFGKVSNDTKDNLNIFYIGKNKNQLVLEGILNYINSKELNNYNSKDEKDNKFDYKRLNELYKETLKCFDFKLVAVKEYLKEPKQVDALQLVFKK